MLDAKIASASEQDHPEFPVQGEVSLGNRKPKKEVCFPRGRQIAFMIYDYFRVTGAHDTVLDYADQVSVTLDDDNIQEFVSRWDDVLLSMSMIRSNDMQIEHT